MSKSKTTINDKTYKAKSRTKSFFTCQNCGAQRPKWEGKCTDCGAWNSFVEEVVGDVSTTRGWGVGSETGPKFKSLSDTAVVSPRARLSTGFTELDRLLGGGLVQGAYVLLGGDPGIGKSTLLLQLSGGLAQGGLQVLYVSAEESIEQTAIRAHRLGVFESEVEVASESEVDAIISLVEERKPRALIVDSIQTVYLRHIESAPGSVSQVRESAGRLMSLAKTKNLIVILVGHVTKEGGLAGPKVLEHMVDTVLSFEGDNNHEFRILRCGKNRFGAINEIAVFRMVQRGLEEVTNPSELFLSEHSKQPIGSSVFASMEGSRPILCEIQALAVRSPLGQPRKNAVGLDLHRVQMLGAILDKSLGCDICFRDVYVSVAGGFRIAEPAADLATAAALLSSIADEPLPNKICLIGELGLSGEVRSVSRIEDRVKEARRLGFSNLILPRSQKKLFTQDQPDSTTGGSQGLEFIGNITELPSLIGLPMASRRSS